MLLSKFIIMLKYFSTHQSSGVHPSTPDHSAGHFYSNLSPRSIIRSCVYALLAPVSFNWWHNLWFWRWYQCYCCCSHSRRTLACGWWFTPIVWMFAMVPWLPASPCCCCCCVSRLKLMLLLLLPRHYFRLRRREISHCCHPRCTLLLALACLWIIVWHFE